MLLVKTPSHTQHLHVKLRDIHVDRKHEIIQITNKAYDKNGHYQNIVYEIEKLNKRTEAGGSQMNTPK